MSRHSLATAVTLYRSGTLTLAQAATRAGRTEEEFAAALERYGGGAVSVGSATGLDREPAGAD